jgi:hypothetical protein
MADHRPIDAPRRTRGIMRNPSGGITTFEGTIAAPYPAAATATRVCGEALSNSTLGRRCAASNAASISRSHAKFAARDHQRLIRKLGDINYRTTRMPMRLRKHDDCMDRK